MQDFTWQEAKYICVKEVAGMAFELYPTPSGPRAAFSVPFSAEHKRFPARDEMALLPLTATGTTSEQTIPSFWACDYDNLYLAVAVEGAVDPAGPQAWRHGDGMVLTLSRQTDCQSTPCYFTLGLAGTTKAPHIHATVTSNGNCAPLTDWSKIKYRLQKSNGTAVFSVTVPWSLLPPLRPLLYETIAVNLTFVRQPGRQFFQLITDPNFDSPAPQLPRLVPVRISFGTTTRPLAQSYLTCNCWRGASPVQINVGLLNPCTCPAQLELRIRDGERILEHHSSSVELADGAHHWTLRWSPQRPLPTGEYTLEIRGEGGGKHFKKEHAIYVLNPQELSSLQEDLLKLEEDINCLYPGAVHTALAQLEWLTQELDACTWAPPDLSKLAEARRIRDDLRNGLNPLPPKPGLSRYAFRSQVDGSLQPYSLYLPKGFDLDHKWPLLLLLHGEETTEQELAGEAELHKLADKLGLILLFPRARTAGSLYLDLDEADVMHNLALLRTRLPLDWNKLFVGGLGKGGFGAWHIGLRHPDHFAGLAAIAGIPALPLAGEDFGAAYTFNPLDFSANARKMALLVVHGAKDSVVPVEPVREIVAALREQGAQPVYKEYADGGHGDLAWFGDLASWLKPLLKS